MTKQRYKDRSNKQLRLGLSDQNKPFILQLAILYKVPPTAILNTLLDTIRIDTPDSVIQHIRAEFTVKSEPSLISKFEA